ncbi:hypothetical protein D3874_06250 [Oleomonas cavernae]|uniref:Uncharacterized protein n=1 Tax=Oleomonas cavernae TaxID=2320859 RepID=A0A418W9H1_9PROT|nr:hypothetical protein [Oleomonas cavernae]RJF86672.1 hypothetical protein D3874_06250 [Oleomonas cavernae]
MTRHWLVAAALLSLPAGARAQDDTAWRVECAPTSTIIGGRMTPAGACAALLAGETGLRLWTAARTADGREVRAPSVAVDFAVPPDRVAIVGGRFSANAAVLAAGASYRFAFPQAPAIEGKCDRLTVPPRPAVVAEGGPRPKDIDRIGCQIEDAAALLRGALEAEESVTVSITVAGIRLSGTIALPQGAGEAYGHAEARLNGAPAAAEPAPPDLDEVEDPGGPAKPEK